MNNGQRIIARQATEIVLRNAGAATTAFVQVKASKVKPGDEVCVIGPAFVERARTIVNVRAKAAEEIREYHQQVERRFAKGRGRPRSRRGCAMSSTRWVRPGCRPTRARYWVDLDQELEKAAHDVVPHAPQDRETFLRFTAALGIGTSLAENFWLWRWSPSAPTGCAPETSSTTPSAESSSTRTPQSRENSGRSADVLSLGR